MRARIPTCNNGRPQTRHYYVHLLCGYFFQHVRGKIFSGDEKRKGSLNSLVMLLHAKDVASAVSFSHILGVYTATRRHLNDSSFIQNSYIYAYFFIFWMEIGKITISTKTYIFSAANFSFAHGFPSRDWDTVKLSSVIWLTEIRA